MTSEMLQCYNRSCGQLFDPSTNTSESCLHHPGFPVFHDAYKRWSCCEKKTTDFTEFLNIKGCTRSYHSNVKPPEPPKSTQTKLEETYKGEESNMETCFYHPGIPIFHEGLKYWSCCVKRTTDFDSFLEQVGCTTGNHKWFKDDDDNQATKTKCRYDWHQTGNTVVISVYSKCPIPDLSFVKANQVKLHIYITFGEKKSIFDEEILLFGAIRVADCHVTYLGSKVEIKLKKAGLLQSWKYLVYEADKEKSVPAIETIKIEDNNEE